MDAINEQKTALDSGKVDPNLHRLENILEESIPVLIRQGRDAFRANLPQLMRHHSGQWVAFNGDKQVGLGGSKTEVYQHCLSRGLRPNQFLVMRIEVEATNDAELPVDV